MHHDVADVSYSLEQDVQLLNSDFLLLLKLLQAHVLDDLESKLISQQLKAGIVSEQALDSVGVHIDNNNW